ncbi:PTS-dependent dihydroxyacetone kinase operon transcriptional regulator DhaR [Escherichia coli]|uniref:dihydroxyacetone kinase operon transcriptional regulator DhaR n=1 Tax=Escherichia TaxID=561 RepID=UPI0015930549|nr:MULTISPECIES: dihydroxyacetone kinase operon transcriptional regulator DhaR [Escherichia]EFB2825930.1 PTS-dependent dihydroxyacetone kinase operon transcriptional regulator DhaR [Escherichia coli]EFH7121634.1 PTS-dependent dihydroxyacetone kinase operon transcriptional regulator DhaR [Escherichia coli]MBB2331318.1 PTS-dependent dihydroxyacetone kinase operon transcriptional regulator DhaR [Escherichia sp. 93.0816]MCC4040435.1 PTS-dependent dihydroxyacetone kinase operon transcriptional regul
MRGGFHNDDQANSPWIAASWERCRKLMKRESWSVPHQAQGVTFATICRRKKAMLTLGQAALEDALEYMAPRACVLLILDETACILSRYGDPQTMEQLSALGFYDGTYCAEGIIGTCALSLAAISGQAVKTIADQHFKQALWKWAFCATPLFDSKGRLTGTIALACPAEQSTAADLPLTLAIAREVGNLLLTDSLLAETNRHLNQLNALLESMDDGVISWDEQGNLQFINAQAARVLRLDVTASQGRAITELLTLPAVLQQAIKQAHPLKHVEATFESQHQFIDTVITLKPIIEAQGTSFILLLHPVEQMRQLMTSQLGKVSHTFAHMPQDDPQTRRLIHFGRQAARSSFPVLLCGEEGVGKALLSQAIHNESERAAGPYIAVNCELYGDATLVEEFIGGDRTENKNGRLSRLELAHGGTLFLEKIEYLAVELQSALLQVIKQGVITRLDARRLIPIDVKVIATTTADLAMLVEQNRFSRQLYYALHAFEITIPPLRMRRGSIPALVNNKLRNLEKRFSTRLKIDDDALARLVSCAWPGNDFELYSVIENLALSSDNGRIRVSNLPEHLFTEQATEDISATRLSTSLSFAEVEKEAIINAAQVTDGRILEMSALLGIGRTTLWRKMKQHGIDAGQFKRRG